MSNRDREVERPLTERAARAAGRRWTERELEEAATFSRAALGVAGHELDARGEELVTHALREGLSQVEFVALVLDQAGHAELGRCPT